MAREVSKAEIDEIRFKLADMAEKRLSEGYDPENTVLCDCCLYPKVAYRFVLYKWWHLCGECALDYEIALAAEEVKTVEQFMSERDSDRLLLTDGLDI